MIYSVSRRGLNELLLDAADAEDNITLHFEHELQHMSAESGEITFRNGRNRKQVTRKADFILGCDGAYSAVRRELIKISRMDFSQSYIQHGYKEFCVPAGDNGKWKLSENYLHIWPRHDYMLIALPNSDGTFTATLFYPYEAFEAIKSDEEALKLFSEQFPEALEAIGTEKVIHDYRSNPTGSLVTIRCSKYHYRDKVLLLGDAAHAMVPFYGQGMNAGFEDLLVLSKLLRSSKDRATAFSEYSQLRRPDAHAICDLALYNYWEMSTGVSSMYFRLKRALAGLIHKIAPQTFVPLYSMVAFSTIPYAEVVRRNRRQGHIMAVLASGAGLSLMGALGYLLGLLTKRRS